MRFPDFFIAGAPKCGTTSLYEYLRTHPSIFMPFPKEPNHYCPDVKDFCSIGDRDAYLSLYKDAPNDARWGEGSTFYLCSRKAAPTILKDNPNAKFIVCLRDPVDMFLSYHGQVLFGQREMIKDPELAWRAQSARSSSSGMIELLDYSLICSLGAQVERLLAHVPRSQVHFVLFDDIARKPQAVYEGILAFLGLRTDGKRDFQVHHPRKSHRFPAVGRFVRNPPFPFDRIKNFLRRAITATGREPPHLYRDLLTVRAEKPKIDPRFHQELQTHFASDVRLLQQLTGFDLSAWQSGKMP